MQVLRFQSLGAAQLTGDDVDQLKTQVKVLPTTILKEQGQDQSPWRPKPLGFAEL
jgi:hypothetical protein